MCMTHMTLLFALESLSIGLNPIYNFVQRKSLGSKMSSKRIYIHAHMYILWRKYLKILFMRHIMCNPDLFIWKKASLGKTFIL